MRTGKGNGEGGRGKRCWGLGFLNFWKKIDFGRWKGGKGEVVSLMSYIL